MTTENITVLFTDLVGSTHLQSSMPPDLADEIRRDHFTVLRQAIGETGESSMAGPHPGRLGGTLIRMR